MRFLIFLVAMSCLATGCAKWESKVTGPQADVTPKEVVPFITKRFELDPNRGQHVQALESELIDISDSNHQNLKTAIRIHLLLDSKQNAELLVTRIEQNGTTAPLVQTSNISTSWKYREEVNILNLDGVGTLDLSGPNPRLFVDQELESLKEVPKTEQVQIIPLTIQDTWVP